MTSVLYTQPTRIYIAAMFQFIPGVRTAFTNIPRVLQDAELPASVVFNGPATYDKHTLGEQMVRETRTYQLMLFVQNAAFDTMGQSQIDCDPFFQAVRNYFLARPGLALESDPDPKIPAVEDAELLGDGGYSVGPYPLNAGGTGATNYVQIRWQLQVREIAQIDYAD